MPCRLDLIKRKDVKEWELDLEECGYKNQLNAFNLLLESINKSGAM